MISSKWRVHPAYNVVDKRWQHNVFLVTPPWWGGTYWRVFSSPEQALAAIEALLLRAVH